MTTALLGLGSNLGDRSLLLDFAVQRLRETHGILEVCASSYYETQPVGGPGNQPAFLNAAARVETSLAAEELFHEMQRIEQEAGRTRETHWGPRTLDLDLLLFGTTISRHGMLIIPHRLLRFRRFVLEPAAEIAGDMIEPCSRCKVSDLWGQLQTMPPDFEIWCPIPGLGEQIRTGLLAVNALPRMDVFVWNEESNQEFIARRNCKARFICMPSEDWLKPESLQNRNDPVRYQQIRRREKVLAENAELISHSANLLIGFENTEDAVQQITMAISAMR